MHSYLVYFIYVLKLIHNYYNSLYKIIIAFQFLAQKFTIKFLTEKSFNNKEEVIMKSWKNTLSIQEAVLCRKYK